MNAIHRATSLLALLFFAAFSQAAPPSRWTILDLGDMAGGIGGTIARDINDRGEIVGEATAALPGGGFALHGFVWSDGRMHDMGVPAGSSMSMAYDLNDRGTVLAGDGLGPEYLWKDGVWSRLTFGGFTNDMNKFGALTGTYLPIAGRAHAFIYRDGVVQDLGTLGGTSATGAAINDRGEVAGHSTIAGESQLRAFVYRDGAMHDIGSFGGFHTNAYDINNRGVVVGASVDGANQALAFIYDGTAMRRLLPDLPPPQRAVAINDRGAVVGDLGQNGSFLYEDGEVTLLESLPGVAAAGWTRLVPTALNDRGWITGWGIKPGKSIQAFVLIPR